MLPRRGDGQRRAQRRRDRAHTALGLHAALIPLAATLLAGCAASGGPAAPRPPAAAFACSPASATIDTGPLVPADDVLVLAERAGFVSGSQTTPALTFSSGIETTVDTGAEIDPFATDRTAWVAAIVAHARPVPRGFGDERALATLRRTTEYPLLYPGSGVYVVATIAAAQKLPFAIECGGAVVASGAIVSPSAEGPVRTLLYDCGQAALGAVAALVQPTCGGPAPSAKDATG